MGDLIVRLKLQYDDYKKGLKKASSDTNSFANTLGKIKAVGVAVWAAIGASVICFAKQMIEKSNAIGDAWARTTAQMKGAWDTFVQSIAAFNFNNLIGRMKEAANAAKELTSALDSEFETNNSIRLQRAAMEEELAALEIIAKDQNKTYKERAAAAQKYLDMVKPLYDQQIALAKRLEDVHIGKWLAGSGLQDSEQTRSDLRNFLVAYGKDEQLVSALGRMMKLQNSYDQAMSTRFRSGNFTKPNAIIQEYQALRSFVKDYEKNNGYGTSIYALATVYEKMRGDADTQSLVDAMIAAGEAAGAFNRETKRLQSAVNSAIAKIDDNTTGNTGAENNTASENLAIFAGTLEMLPAIAAKAEAAVPDILSDEWLEKQIANGEAFGEWYMDLIERTTAMNQMLEDATVAAISGTMQAFTDLMMGVEGAGAEQILSALLQPFGQTAIQLGEMLLAQGIAVDAFKTSLASLQGAPAIAAGLALIAVGSTISSGIRAMANGPGGGSTATTASASSTGVNKYEQEITINVVGEISGDKIILAGQKTLNKWSR